MTEKNPQVVAEIFLDDGSTPAEATPTITNIPNRFFFRIGEVARCLGVSPSVVRYWESEFRIIKPERSRSGQRLYRRKDLENLALIKELLYEHRFTVEGAKLQMSKARHKNAAALEIPELIRRHRLIIASLQELMEILTK